MYLDLTEDGSEFLIKYTPRDCFVSEKSLAIAYQLRALFGDKLTYSEEVKTWAFAEREKRDNRAITTVSGPLYPHQERGAEWLYKVRSGLLAYDCGTGKSAACLRALDKLKEEAFPALLICPATLKRTWSTECEKWYPQLKVLTTI